MNAQKKKKIDKKHIRLAVAILGAFTFVWVLIDILLGNVTGAQWFVILHRFGHSAIVMMLLSSLSVVFKNYRVPEGWYPHKILGLYALLYATAHFLTYWSLFNFNFPLILQSIQTQTFILFGNFAWIIMLVMEVTSTKQWRTKHNKAWRIIHYFYNAAVVAVVIHVSLASKVVRPIVFFYAAFFVIFITLHIKAVRDLLLKNKK
ncbi:MAG: ferric reductase-like transmembrane domain-containing protein [Anaerolineae bacterium]|nr:ferric reductase-like transmembrane domain-containing protein [Anaerolineae bacterium]